MNTDLFNERHEELKARLRYLKQDIDKVLKDVNQGYYGGLGGSLQNVWGIYYLMGQLEAMNRESAEKYARAQQGIIKVEEPEGCDGHCTCNDCIEEHIRLTEYGDDNES